MTQAASSQKPPNERDAILLAASRVFLTRGFKGVSLEDIAAEAKVPAATLIRHAGSVDELLHQLLVRDTKKLMEIASTQVVAGRPILQILEGVAEKTFDFLEATALMRLLMIGTLDTAFPDWATQFDELRQRCLSVPVAALKQGVAQGEIRKDLPLDLVAGLMFELQMSGFILHHKKGKDRAFKAAQRRKAGVALLVDGLRPR
jgi:TetR/AcrR family transcriptional regulator, cholesterol catabolism regulator